MVPCPTPTQLQTWLEVEVSQQNLLLLPFHKCPLAQYGISMVVTSFKDVKNRSSLKTYLKVLSSNERHILKHLQHFHIRPSSISRTLRKMINLISQYFYVCPKNFLQSEFEIFFFQLKENLASSQQSTMHLQVRSFYCRICFQSYIIIPPEKKNRKP